MIPQHTMQSSIALTSKQLVQPMGIPPPQSATLGFHTVAHKLLLIFHPAKGRRLS